MNQDVLERLMMDRALDNLPRDVEALLDAYLANEPEQAGRAREISDTVTLAQQVVKPQRAVSLPPLKVCPLPVVPRRETRQHVVWSLRMAAAFALGLVVSPLVMRQASPPSTRPALMATAVVNPARAASSSSLWSVDRWINAETQPSTTRSPRLNWTSPVRKPELNH